MRVATLGEFFSQPNVILLFFALLLCIMNVFVGVSILPKDKRKRGYKLHKYFYWAVLVFYIAFLFGNHALIGNSWFEYIVFFYFVIVLQWSRRINVTLHAVLASVGMVLLVGIFSFRLF
tara:strand:- start:353 stop:709 length:357 start_codon:yes stop_codon:yes gene_type:complete